MNLSRAVVATEVTRWQGRTPPYVGGYEVHGRESRPAARGRRLPSRQSLGKASGPKCLDRPADGEVGDKAGWKPALVRL